MSGRRSNQWGAARVRCESAAARVPTTREWAAPPGVWVNEIPELWPVGRSAAEWAFHSGAAPRAGARRRARDRSPTSRTSVRAIDAAAVCSLCLQSIVKENSHKSVKSNNDINSCICTESILEMLNTSETLEFAVHHYGQTIAQLLTFFHAEIKPKLLYS